MPEIKIVTEVAGRVCALSIEAGGSIDDGDEIAFVEAMKMENTGDVDGIGENQGNIGQTRRRDCRGPVGRDHRNLRFARRRDRILSATI